MPVRGARRFDAAWSVVVCLLFGVVAGCDCDGTRLMSKPKGDALQVIAQDATACGGQQVVLQPIVAGGVPPYQYQWTPTDGLADPTASSITVPGDKARSFELTVTDSGGHSKIVDMQVQPRALPTAQLAFARGEALVCAGDAVVLDASGSGAGAGGHVVSYVWDLGDGSAPISGGAASTPTITPKDGQVVQLTVTDDAGCQASVTQKLSVRGLPTPQATFVEGSASVCRGTHALLDASGSHDADGNPVQSYAWDLDGDPSTSESTDATSGRFLPDGHPARLTVTDAVGCKASLDVGIDARTPPTAVITSSLGSAQLCAGAPVVLDASGSKSATGGQVAGYRWDLDGDPLSVESTDPKAQLAVATARTVHLTVTDQNGCSADASLELNPRALPSLPLVVASGDANGCAGDQITLSAAGAQDADGNPVASYAWDVDGNGTIDATTDTTTVTEQAPAQAKVTVTDAQGCTSSGTIALTPHALPTPKLTFAQGAAETCGSVQIQLDASASRDAAGNPVKVVAWDLDGDASTIESTSAKTAPFFPTASGVRLTVTDVNGCKASLAQALTQHALPSASIRVTSGGAQACAGTTIALDGSGSHDASGAAPASFAWDLDGDASTVESTAATPPSFALAAARTVSLVVKDANGCSANASLDLAPRALPNLPVVVASGNANGCVGDSVTLSAAGARDADGNPVASYAWDLDGNGTIDATTDTTIVTEQVPAQAKVTVTDAQGCSNSGTIALTPHALPTPRLTFVRGANEICGGVQLQLDASASRDAAGNPVKAVAWDLDGNPSTIESTSALTDPFLPTASDLHLTVTDVNGCKASLDQPLERHALPTASIRLTSGSAQACEGTTIALDGSGSRDASGGTQVTYAWDLDGVASTVESTVATPPSFALAAARTVRLTVTDVSGCAGSASLDLTPRALPTLPVAVSGNVNGCAGDQITLSAAGAQDADGNPVASYAWDVDGNGTVDATSAATTLTPQVPALATVTVADAQGCKSSSTVALNPHALPTPQLSFVQGAAETCGGVQTQFDASGSHDASGKPVTAFAWDFDGNPATVEATSATTDSFVPTADHVRLTVADFFGCKASIDQPITQHPLPVASIRMATGAPLACLGATIALDGSGSRAGSGSLSYAWDLDGNASTVESTSATPPAFVLAANRDVQLTVKDAFGCTASAQQHLQAQAPPTARIALAEGENSMCAGDLVRLSAAGSIDANGNPVASYEWTYADEPGGVPVRSAQTPQFAPSRTQQVQLKVIDSLGCQASAAQQLAVRPLPTVAVAFTRGSASICAGDQVQLDAGASRDADGNLPAVFAWDLDGNPATIESSSAATSAWAPTAPSVHLTVTDAQGCSASVTQGLELKPLPNAVLAFRSGAPSVCVGTSVELDAGASHDAAGNPVSAIAWDLDGNPVTIESTRTRALLTATGNRNVHLTVTDARGCSAWASQEIDSLPLPRAQISVLQGQSNACMGNQVQLSGVLSANAQGQPVSAYRWQYVEEPGGVPASGMLTPVFTPTSSEVVQLTVTDQNGCQASASQALAPRALPTPVVRFTQGAAQVCQGDSVALDGSASHDADGNPIGTFAWDLDGNSSSIESTSAATGSFLPTSAALLTVTDAQGCSASATQPLTNYALPTARIDFAQGSALVCAGANVVLDAGRSTDASGSAVAAYAWDLDGNQSTVEATSARTPAMSASGVRQALVTVTDAHGCKAQASTSFTARPLPTVVLDATTPQAQLCQGDVVQLSSARSTDADGNPISRVAWDLDGNLSTVESTAVQPAPLAIDSARTVTVTVTDPLGCSAQAARAFTPRALPSASLSFVAGRTNVCLGDSVTLGVSNATDSDGNPLASIQWDVNSDGTSDGTGTRSPAFTPTAPQTASVTLTDARGCARTLTQTVSPRALPTPSIQYVAGSQLVCAGGQVQLDGSGSRDADGNAVASWAWDTNGDGTNDQSTARTTLFTPPRSAGVGLTVVDRLGCRASATSALTVRALPTAQITFPQGSATMCAGSSVQLSGATSSDADGNPVASWAWDLDGNPASIESTSATPPSFVPASSRTTTLTVVDAIGCRASASQPLTVRALPPVNAGADVRVCQGTAARIGSSAVAGVSYSWWPNGGLDDAFSSSPRATPSTTTRYVLTATSAEGCTAQDDVVVQVNQLPVVDAGPDRPMASNGSTQLLGSVTGGLAPYGTTWTPATALSSASVLQPRAQPASDTTYTLSATDANGCQAQDSAVVRVLAPMSVNAGADLHLCRDGGSSVPLTATVTSGVAPFTYSWSAQPSCPGCIASPASASTSVSPTADTVFTVTVTDANGTTATDSVQVQVLASLKVDAGPDRTVSRGGTTTIGTPGISGITYSWACSRASCGLTDPSAAQTVVRPEGSTAYTLTGTDGLTCYAQDSVMVYTNPTVLATVPTEGYSPWSRDAPLFVIFDSDMDPASFANNVHLWDPLDGTRIWISTSYDVPTRMLKVQPLDTCPSGSCDGDHRYWNNRPYVLRLTGGTNGVRTATSPAIALYNDFLLTFTASSMGDGVAPQLAYTQPANFGLSAPVGTSVVIRFDEPADPRTVNASTISIAGVPATVAYDPRTWTATLRPTLPLAPNSSYTVRVVGVQDGPGNATNTSFQFTTGGADTTAPTIVSSTPAQGGTSALDVATHVRVTFSEPVDTRTLGGMRLIDQATGMPLAGKLLYDEASRTADLEPQSFLEPAHGYRLDVSNIADQSGNLLAAPLGVPFVTSATLLAERFDAAPAGWTLQSPWGLDIQAARAGLAGLSDSPGTTYQASSTVIATAPVLNVTGRSSVTVRFWSQRILATDQDAATVEYSSNGTSWTTGLTLQGVAGWGVQSFQVPVSGARLYLRLRLSTDRSVNLDGWFIDDFVVR